MKVIDPQRIAGSILDRNIERRRFGADLQSARNAAGRGIQEAIQVDSQCHVGVEHKLAIVVAAPEELIRERGVVGVVLELLAKARVDAPIFEKELVILIVQATGVAIPAVLAVEPRVLRTSTPTVEMKRRL